MNMWHQMNSRAITKNVTVHLCVTTLCSWRTRPRQWTRVNGLTPLVHAVRHMAYQMLHKVKRGTHYVAQVPHMHVYAHTNARLFAGVNACARTHLNVTFDHITSGVNRF